MAAELLKERSVALAKAWRPAVEVRRPVVMLAGLAASTWRPAGCRRALRIRPPSDGWSPPPIWRPVNPPAECLRRPGRSLLAGAEVKVRVAREIAGTRPVPRWRDASAPSRPAVRPEQRETRPSSMWRELRRDPAGTGDPGSSRPDGAWVRRSGEPNRPVGSPPETPSRGHPELCRAPERDHRD